MIVDFHTHSTASDGELSPVQLLASAVAAGVTQFAITDHDTIDGYLKVSKQVPKGLRLYSGVELSCVWGGVNIHVVGLGFDPEAPAMTAMLDRLSEARAQRSVTIAERLAKKGMAGALEGALAVAADGQVGRPHFAKWMVSEGHVADVNEAFDRFLGQGKIGDVKAFWPTLAEVTEAIAQSGGVPVLAHPLRYKFTRTKLWAMTKDFKAAGGKAVELLNGRQTPDETLILTRLAKELEMRVSLGSDFHRSWRYGPELGVDSRAIGTELKMWELS